jgi:PAS domain S-box-containing protein
MISLNILGLNKKSKKTNSLILESERRFRETLENVSLLAVILDLQGNIIFCNDFTVTLVGWKCNELLGRNWFDMLTPSEPVVKQTFHESMKQGTIPLHFENAIITRSGEKHLISWSNSILRDAEGIIVGITSIGEDITERRKQEVELNLIKLKLELALQSSKMGVWQYDIEKNIRRFDNQVCTLLGIDPAKFGGSAEEFFAVIHPEDHRIVKTALEKAIEQHDPYESDYRVIWSDGSIHYITARGKLSINNDGIPLEINGILWDNTRQKKADEALIYERSLFRTIIDLIPDAVYVKNLNGQKVLANPKEVQLCGKNSENEVIGKTDFNLLTETDAKRALAEDEYVLQTGKPILDIEGSLLDNEGKLHYLLGAKIAMHDIYGKINGIVGLTRDITERRDAEMAKQESDAIYRNLVLKLPDGVYKSTHDGKFIDVNPALVKMFGYDSKEELMAIDIKTQLYFEPAERDSTILEEETIGIEVYSLKKKDGSALWVEDHGWYNTDENGNILSHEGIIRDITQRKKAEEELAQERYLMLMLMDNLPDHIYFKDLESRFVRINKSQAQFFGLNDPDLAIGKTDADFFSGDHSQQTFEDEMTIIRTGKMLNIEEKETYNDRPDTWVSTFKMPLYDKAGKIIGTFGISRDITTQQLYQSEIKLKNEELQKLNAEKDKFFSIIAHDLRNPLGAFMSYTELMVEDIDNLSVHEIKDMAVDMKNSAYNLFNLLENLLEWSRIERGIIGFEPKSYNLMTKINESMQSVLESANKKGIGIGFNVPKDMKVYTDENMLKSTIRNLATNAVKFTPKGGKITLTAKPVYDNFVEISFRDTGIGMNKDILDKLFRLDAHTSRPGTEGEPSSGLGLILCKDFIDKQGGKIWVESEPGKGSVFYFTIPNNEQG